MTTSDLPPGAHARRFPVGLTIAVAIVLAILLALGAWQLQRLAWKEGLLARIAALEAAPARPIDQVLGQVLREGAADLDFTRVTAVCPGLAAAPFVELYALRDGEAGSRIISVCPITSGGYGSLLVDRGFVADTISARPPVDAADARPITVTGVLRAPEPRNFAAPPDDAAHRRFFTRAVSPIAAALGASKPAPVFLFAETATNPEWQALVPAPLPADIPNRHMEYALTWFGLAATLACIYAAMLWRRLKA